MIRKVTPTGAGQPVYRHSAGYLIVREVRDWDWVRGAAGWQPKTSWLVIPCRYARFTDELRRPLAIFRLRREAVAWCDQQAKEAGA